MADIDKLAQKIGGVSGKIDKATTEADDAAQEAEDAANTADALGAEAVATTLDLVKADLDALAATLRGASAQASTIEALTLSVKASKGGGTSGASFPTAASKDPAGVPKPPQKNRRSARRRFNQKTAALAEQAEGAGDVVSLAEETTEGVLEIFKDPPKPPAITGAGTRTADSPPVASPAATPGPDLPNAASGLAAVGIAVFTWKYAVERILRGFSLEEQVPEEVPPPPRARHPWEDGPRSDSR